MQVSQSSTISQKEIRLKYIGLKKRYYKLLSIQKHTEEKLKVVQKELSLKTDKKELKDPETNKLIQDLKNQNTELKKLNSTQNIFISIVAHDLKSPFHSIIGFSKLLHERIHEKKPGDIERMAGNILNSAYRAIDLLEDLLMWALVQNFRLKFNPEKKNLIEVIDYVEPLFYNVCAKKRVSIKNTVPKEFMIYADYEMITVVLRNLISNALKFSNKRETVEIGAKQTANDTIVFVADKGIGIPESKLEDIFQIGRNYRRKGTNNECGTGLGLVLCKDIVEKHGGKIWAESKENEGSIFYFSLPANSLQE